MDIGLSTKTIGKKVSHFIYRFHVILFTIIVLGGLSVLIFILYNYIVNATNINDAENAIAIDSGFDKQTITRLESLQTSNVLNEPIQYIDGARKNPFVE